MKLNSISANVIHAAISVHRELGPGLLESVYQDCMLIELRNLGTRVEGEVALPVFYKGQKIRDDGFRLDLLVEDRVIVELKSVEMIQPVHKKQLLTYLRLANKELVTFKSLYMVTIELMRCGYRSDLRFRVCASSTPPIWPGSIA